MFTNDWKTASKTTSWAWLFTRWTSYLFMVQENMPLVWFRLSFSWILSTSRGFILIFFFFFCLNSPEFFWSFIPDGISVQRGKVPLFIFIRKIWWFLIYMYIFINQLFDQQLLQTFLFFNPLLKQTKKQNKI